MAQSSFPFENVDTTETQFSQMFRTLNAGVNGTPAGTELKVSAGTGLQVSVALGQAMVRGHYYISTAAELLTIGTANATNPRIDTVVLRLDPVANSIVLAVVAGTSAASPVAPTLTQTDAGVYEFPLADIAVAAGAGTVGTITDRRTFMGARLQKTSGAASRDLLFPAPKQGDMVWRDDLGAFETYFSLYSSSTNTGGRTPAGWYTTGRNNALVPVRPASLNIPNGSASANALGTITFTNVSSIVFHDVFIEGYRTYRINIHSISAGAETDLKLRLTASTAAPYTTADYYYGALRGGSATSTITSVGSSAQTTYLVNQLSTVGAFCGGFIEVHNPSVTLPTSIVSSTSGQVSGYSVSMYQSNGAYVSSVVATGFQLLPAGATTISGVVTVYGIAD